MTTTTDARFWIMALDEDEDGRWIGWWGIVDESEGGIVATAGTFEGAEQIRAMLIVAAADLAAANID